MKSKVEDRRRFAGDRVSREEKKPFDEQGQDRPALENQHLPADYKEKLDALTTVPGMSLEGRAALAEARPAPEFAVAPLVSAEAIAEIRKVIEEHKIRPPRGWLLVKELEPGEKIGLILVPDVVQKPAKFGIVLAVGLGEFVNGVEIPPDMKPGDHVKFPTFAGEEDQILGAKVLSMRMDEILLIAG